MPEPIIQYPCGCRNFTDPSSGVLRSLTKCPGHEAMRKEAGELGEAYYRDLGALDADAPGRYVGQLVEALGALPTASGPDAVALEVGCGTSPYIGAIRAAGYHYVGTDPSEWAARWARESHGAYVAPMSLEGFSTEEESGRWELVLAAHCIEHMPDAPGAIRRCAELLAPGGELWVVVPDDEDPVNPDHEFFFSVTTLGRCLLAAGLGIVKVAVRRYVKHESFIYCRARKPASPS